MDELFSVYLAVPGWTISSGTTTGYERFHSALCREPILAGNHERRRLKGECLGAPASGQAGH